MSIIPICTWYICTWRLNTCYSMSGISMNFQKARQPFVVQNGVLAESSRIFALAIGSLLWAVVEKDFKCRQAKKKCSAFLIGWFDPPRLSRRAFINAGVEGESALFFRRNQSKGMQTNFLLLISGLLWITRNKVYSFSVTYNVQSFFKVLFVNAGSDSHRNNAPVRSNIATILNKQKKNFEWKSSFFEGITRLLSNVYSLFVRQYLIINFLALEKINKK